MRKKNTIGCIDPFRYTNFPSNTLLDLSELLKEDKDEKVED